MDQCSKPFWFHWRKGGKQRSQKIRIRLCLSTQPLEASFCQPSLKISKEQRSDLLTFSYKSWNPSSCILYLINEISSSYPSSVISADINLIILAWHGIMLLYVPLIFNLRETSAVWWICETSFLLLAAIRTVGVNQTFVLVRANVMAQESFCL